MSDPRKFKAPFIPKERIWQEADRLRATHPAGHFLCPHLSIQALLANAALNFLFFNA